MQPVIQEEKLKAEPTAEDRTQFVNMRRWTPAKLAKEVAFARAADDPTEQEWLNACEAEVTRRYGKPDPVGLTETLAHLSKGAA